MTQDWSIKWTAEDEYLELLYYILDKGEPRNDRTGVGTKAVFGVNLSFDLSEGFPLLTTKKMPFKSILSELLWFIEGSGDERRLAEILHGTRDAEKKTIWTANAQATTGSKFSPQFAGDLGRVYGVQWRNWQSAEVRTYEDYLDHDDATTTYFNAKVQVTKVDQLARLIEGLKSDPHGRRHVLTAWNPGELHRMALPPCHMFAQFYLSNDRKLSCQLYMRSVDTFLGLPFNIASYALLTHMIARVIDAEVGSLTMMLGDTHIYDNHVQQVQEQLKRETRPLPKLCISTDALGIDNFKMDDFTLEGYDPYPAISAPMAA